MVSSCHASESHTVFMSNQFQTEIYCFTLANKKTSVEKLFIASITTQREGDESSQTAVAKPGAIRNALLLLLYERSKDFS